MSQGRSFTKSITMSTVYFALSFLQLIFAYVVWNLHYQIHIELIENLKSKFLRILGFKCSSLLT